MLDLLLKLRNWFLNGFRFGLVTGRASHIVRMRAAELGVELVRQGVEEKLPAVQQILAELQLKPDQVCYVGDDLPDLPPLLHVGLGVAVADGAAELCQAAHYVTKAPGGSGAIRETIEMILKRQGRWEDLIQKYK